MERAMSVEDKIRRAEEIYYKRKEQDVSVGETIRKISTEKKNIKLLRKMIRQIIICLVIYGIFYIIVNNNYIFSADFTNKAREILSQDINFSEVYSVISNKVIKTYNQITNSESANNKEEQQNEEVKNENIESEKINSENESEQNTEPKNETTNNDENIGGAEEMLAPVVEENETKELSQMEQDANYIKSIISFIKPINGKISSSFGWRNPSTETVPKNHTGTDIAAETGTQIVSATDGTVMLSSTTGDYGKHLKIQIGDVIIVYAHCSKLYVNEGDMIKQGQEIAEVGSTGNATGPHLHFEVRYQDRYVNPQLILEL